MIAFGNRRIERERQQEEWAGFEAEVLPHTGDLFRIAMWLMKNRAVAEDLVQETLTQALESFHRYETGTNVRAWLLTIMYRVRGRQQRAAERFRLVDNAEERIAESIAFEPSIAPGLTDEEVLAALERLPPQFREAVVLSDVEELSYKEIAEVLRIPKGTVMSRLNRGRKLLRAELTVFANTIGIGKAPTQRRAIG